MSLCHGLSHSWRIVYRLAKKTQQKQIENSPPSYSSSEQNSETPQNFSTESEPAPSYSSEPVVQSTTPEVVGPGEFEPVSGQQTDTVGFSNKAPTTGVIPPSDTQTEEEITAILPDTMDKTIPTILSRWSKHGTDYGFLPTVDYFHLPYLIHQHAAFDKLKGFYGFTANFEIKLVWNSDPFVQGMYMLAYGPPHAYPPAKITDRLISDAVYCSGLPRTIFNVNSQTSATLSVPYFGPDSFIKTGNPLIELLGYFYIVPLCPVEGPACFEKLDYNVYFRLTNLKTYGAYPADFFMPSNFHRIEPQMEEAKQKQGSLATTGKNIASFLDNFADAGVPYADKASWLVGGASKIADLLGWSKPISVTPLTSVQKLSYLDATTSDTTFSGAKLAHNFDAGISKIDLSTRKIDEMQISNALSRPNLLPFLSGNTLSKQHLWESDQPVGTELHKFDIDPTLFRVASKMGDKEAYINTHLSYIAGLFDYWRGSIKFMLKFANTSYQTGRLRVVFIPKSDVQFDPKLLPYTYAQIIDIRDPQTWEFEIPYMRERPWLQTGQVSGTIVIYVETPLKAACAVLQKVSYCLFVSAGKDLEFAIPSIPDSFPVVQTTTHPGHATRIEPQSLSQNQMLMLVNSGHREFELEDSVAVPIVPASKTSSVNAHRIAFGDPIRSLRTLIKKFYPSTDPTWSASSHPLVTTYNLPFTPTTEKGPQDMLSYIGPLFAFWRGGMRIYAQNYAVSRVAAVPTIAAPTNAFCQQGSNGSIDFSVGVHSFASVGPDEPAKFEIPYYYPTRCRNSFLPGPDIFYTIVYEAIIPGAEKNIVQRAAADDYDMGFLVGAPVTQML